MKKLINLFVLILLRKRLFIAGMVVLVLGIIIFKPFGILKGSERDNGLKTESVKRSNLSTTINASGTIEAEKIAKMGFLTSGRVSWVGFKQGDAVKEGQVVAALDNSEYRINVSDAEADLKYYQSALDKVLDDIRLSRDTGDENGETQTQKTNREQAEMARDSAYQALQKSKKQLEWTTIIAPFSGVISELAGISVGQNITATSNSYIVIINNDILKFTANVDEIDFSKLYLGQEGIVILDAFPSEEITGRISKIGITGVKLSTGGSVIPVELSLPADDRFRSGLNGEVNFSITSKENALTIPRSALHKDGDNQFVYVWEGNKPEKKEIVVGEIMGGQAEILAGLEEGIEVILGDIKK